MPIPQRLSRLTQIGALTLLLSGCDKFTPQDVASAGSTALVVESVVQGLREASDNAAQAFDQVAANRLEEAANRLEALLPSLRGVLEGAEKNANGVVDNANREMAGTLATLRTDLQSIGGYATANVNAYLAQASAMMDAVPFIGVTPAVFSITPTVLDSLSARAVVRIAGHLPGDPNEDVLLTINGAAATVTRASRHTLTFHVPDSLHAAGTAISLLLRVRERKGPFGWFSKWHEFSETVRVGAETPFTCAVDTYTENPDLLQPVASTKTYVVEASTQGSANRANENRILSASSLFQSTVDSASSYDLESVRILSLGATVQRFGGGCGDEASFGSEIQSGGLLASVRAHAPYLSRRTRKRGFLKYQYCDQGGTKVVASLSPTFRAALKSTPALRRTRSDTLRLGDAGASVVHSFGSSQRWAYHVSCSYRDGTESWTTARATIDSKNLSSLVRGLQTRVAEDRLLLEPLAPARFADSP